MSLGDIRNERIKKLNYLQKAGINPYPENTERDISIAEVHKEFADFLRSGHKISVAGRVMAKREHGGAMFLDLKDASGKIQIYFKRDILKDAYDLAVQTLDVGDFISASGVCFKTRKNEETIEASSWRMLAKSLRPLPEKWEGLKDVEERFRKRYLDLLIDDDVRERFKARSNVISFLRNALEQEGFLEVETPILQPIPGGAEARPFVTHHNALNCDFYLRIAPELYLKRLLVGGFEKVFEIARNFRNEGIDRDHNPEFTMLELYWAYQDRAGLMSWMEDFVKKAAERFGENNLASKKWETIEFSNIFKKYSGKDYKEIPVRELDEVFKHKVRPKIIDPTFVIDYPETIMALAKFHADNPFITESFQLIVRGTELAKGFSEMNDPRIQREQMERQEKDFRSGVAEASRLDEDFLEALEYGMPPAAGLGLGIDRLVMLLTGTENIREAVFFPTLRPK